MTGVRDRAHRGLAQGAVSLVFVLSRVGAWLAGVRFDDDTLVYWQCLDVRILRDDLLRGLLYLHAQPPLYNLFLGVVLKLFAEDQRGDVFAFVFHSLGLLGALAAVRLLMHLGVRPLLAAAATCIYLVSPAAILYENWLFYTWPVAVSLVFAAYALERTLTTRRRDAAACFFACLVAIALTRSVYHLVWVMAVGAVVVCWSAPGQRRTVATYAAIAVLIVGGWYAKNALLFGSFASSTWLGMSLGRVTVARMDPIDRDALIRNGTLSRVADVPPFAPLERYPREVIQQPGPDHPALREAFKPGLYGVNRNHIAYVHIAELYKHDALWVIAHRTGVYARSVRAALRLALRAPSQEPTVATNRGAMASYESAYNRWLLGASSDDPDDESPTRFACVLVAGACLAAVYGIARHRGETRWRVLAFALGTAAFSFVVSNLVELGENDRFRMEIEPLLGVVTVAALAAPRRKVALQAPAPAPAPRRRRARRRRRT